MSTKSNQPKKDDLFVKKIWVYAIVIKIPNKVKNIADALYRKGFSFVNQNDLNGVTVTTFDLNYYLFLLAKYIYSSKIAVLIVY